MSSDEAGSDAVAARIAAVLRGAGPFRLWLVGDLGAGKTHLTGAILRALGLGADVPVRSPTYTYCNEYEIDGVWYAHLDLYRAGDDLSLEELGLVDARPYRGFFVEWPDKVPAHPVLAPDYVVAIAFEGDGSTRRYELTKS